MPLPLPRLDTHTFDQLLEEGTALLPRLAPGWTDYNLHDPGITLVELLAWLVEMDIYRLDRTSPAAFRNFLRLVGIYPHPARPARAVLVFTSIKAAGKSLPLPKGFQITNQAQSIGFQARRLLVVSPASLQSVLAGDEAALSDCTALNETAKKGFAPFGTDPRPGTALYLGFDQPLATHARRVSLYFWSPSPEQDAAVAADLAREAEFEQDTLEHADSRPPHPRVDWRLHYSARTRWEYFSGAGGWRPLLQVSDETRGLTLSGAVRFKLPQTHLPARGGLASKPGQFFIRCRLLCGYYEYPPQILKVALNAIPVRNAWDSPAEEVQADGNGCAGQGFSLNYAPVLPGSTHLRVHILGRKDEVWSEALSWEQVRPHDRSYVLSPESGQISFGDGLHGRVPPDGAKITVLKYNRGGGLAGNLPAGQVEKYLGPEQVSVKQPFPAFGGMEAETLEEAKGRAMQWLSSPQRAVSLADFETLALQTPGVPVLRAHALADYDPALPFARALGCVTVVVLPSCANARPEAGPDMLCAVQTYLERRRTLTAEVHVIAPGFVTISVRAQLSPMAGTDARALLPAAAASLNAFLDPLRGGADGLGWPMGRAVYQSEIMAVLNAVPGVEFVDEVRIEVMSRLQVYRGYITWMQVFEWAGSSITLMAQLCAKPCLPASLVTRQARQVLDAYFKTLRGSSNNLPNLSLCQDVTDLLAALPDVLGVESVRIDESSDSAASCGFVTLCAHEVVVPGAHQIRLASASAQLNASPDC